MSQNFEAELTVGPQAIDAYSRLSYTMWFALAEFVDNSTQSRFNYDGIISEVLQEEGCPLTIDIVHNKVTKEISIKDNSIGMTRDDLVNALRIAYPTQDSKGRSKYGMGLKTAACWIGAKWTVKTCEWESGQEWTATIDVNAIAGGNSKVPMTMRKVDASAHYTEITISNLRRRIQTRSEDTIKTYLGSIYMFDLSPDDTGKVGLKLTYNGEEVKPPDESDWDTDPSGSVYRRDLPTLNLGGKTVNGWIGVQRKGGRKYGGFSLFQNKRQIQGFPSAWKPRSIFGGVDDEGANNLVTQRLTGVLLLNGFVVSHTKDAVLFEGDEEDKLEEFLVKETKAYAEYSKKRRNLDKRGLTKEQVRELANDMKPEFTSAELQDALNTAVLPPFETISASNRQQRDSLTTDDEIARFEILPDLTVILSLKEQSAYEPHVVFVPGASAGVLHVIVNRLHPYYHTIESKDAIIECFQQYMYDAVAEFKTEQLISNARPDSIRSLKDKLLRARADQLDNADAKVRSQAEAELFSRDSNEGNTTGR